MTRDDLRARLRHLMQQAKVLNTLDLRAVHEPTGYPVWLMVSLTCDAIERTVRDLAAVPA